MTVQIIISSNENQTFAKNTTSGDYETRVPAGEDTNRKLNEAIFNYIAHTKRDE